MDEYARGLGRIDFARFKVRNSLNDRTWIQSFLDGVGFLGVVDSEPRLQYITRNTAETSVSFDDLIKCLNTIDITGDINQLFKGPRRQIDLEKGTLSELLDVWRVLVKISGRRYNQGSTEVGVLRGVAIVK